jgi:ATP-dependent Clp protease protease subunit
LVLSADIDDASVGDIIESILDINSIDDDLSHDLCDYKREPIKLVINSFGGSVYDGFALIAAIEGSKTPIHGYAYGSAMSMAFAIYIATHVRFAHKTTTFMYHEILWSLNEEKLSSHKREVEEGKRIMDIYDSIILECTNLTKKQLDIVKKEYRDWYMSAEDALVYGIIDEIC